MISPHTSQRAPLNRATIVAAAIELADADGAATFTMRALADHLGFKVMSLYNHVASKDELLALMVDAVAAEIAPPSPDTEAMAAVREVAMSTRAALVRHPWAPGLWLHHVPGPARSVQMEHLLQTLAESGLRPELAHHGFHAVNNHVLGYTLQELAMTVDQRYAEEPDEVAREFIAGLADDAFPHTIAHVHQHLDGETESSFELVLDLILDGLVRLDAENRRADQRDSDVVM